MTELCLRMDSWGDTYDYQFFVVEYPQHKSLFIVSHGEETKKTQYDFTRIIKLATTSGGVQVVLDNQGKLDFFECFLTTEHADEFVAFMKTKIGKIPHKTE